MFKKQALFISALVLAASGIAHAQTADTTNSSNRAEVQRGVPGVDVDIKPSDREQNPRRNGMPGVDVDVRTNDPRTAGDSADTRRVGAGADTRMSRSARSMRSDRN